MARRVERLFGKKQAARYFAWEMVALGKQEQKSLPAQKRGCKSPTHRFQFQFDQAAVERDEVYDGYSALAATVPQPRAFNSYVFLIHPGRVGREVRPTRLSNRQRELLQILGFPSPAKTISQLLARPPT